MKPLLGPNVAVRQIRQSRLTPYDFMAFGRDDAAHLAIMSSQIRSGVQHSTKAIANALEGAALAVGRANRHARFAQRQLELSRKPKKGSRHK